MSVAIADYINSFLDKFLSSELLTLENDWFCLSYNASKESIKDTSIIQSAPILVIHLKHFCVERDKVIKDTQLFKYLAEEQQEFLFWATTLWWPQLTFMAVWTMDTNGQL